MIDAIVLVGSVSLQAYNDSLIHKTILTQTSKVEQVHHYRFWLKCQRTWIRQYLLYLWCWPHTSLFETVRFVESNLVWASVERDATWRGCWFKHACICDHRLAQGSPKWMGRGLSDLIYFQWYETAKLAYLQACQSPDSFRIGAQGAFRKIPTSQNA